MSEAIPFRVGEWLSSDQAFLEQYMEALIDEVDAELKPLHPVIEEFKDLIESDAEIYMLFNQMFTQVPHRPPYNKSPTGKPQVRDYHHMLHLINAIMTKAPEGVPLATRSRGMTAPATIAQGAPTQAAMMSGGISYTT